MKYHLKDIINGNFDEFVRIMIDPSSDIMVEGLDSPYSKSDRDSEYFFQILIKFIIKLTDVTKMEKIFKFMLEYNPSNYVDNETDSMCMFHMIINHQYASDNYSKLIKILLDNKYLSYDINRMLDIVNRNDIYKINEMILKHPIYGKRIDHDIIKGINYICLMNSNDDDIISQINKCSNINELFDDVYGSPLHIICQICENESTIIDIFKLFMSQQNFNPNALNKTQVSVLDLICNMKVSGNIKYELVIMFLEHSLISGKIIGNALHFACPNDRNIKIIKTLLVHPNIDLSCNMSFHIVCGIGNLELVQLFLEDKRIDINAFDFNMNTPLNLACDANNIEIVRMLLLCPELNVSETNPERMFNVACHNGFIGIVKLLLEDGRYDPNMLSYTGITSLESALNAGHFDISGLLLNDPRIIIRKDVCPITDRTKNKWSTFEFLQNDDRFDLYKTYDSGTILHAFYDSGKHDIENCIKITNNSIHKIDYRATDIFDNTIFHILCRNQMIDVLKIWNNTFPTLIEEFYNKKNNNEATPIHNILNIFETDDKIIEKQIELLNYLFTFDEINWNNCHDHDTHILHIGVLTGSVKIIDCLIKSQKFDTNDLNKKNEHGYTPFHLACCLIANSESRRNNMLNCIMYLIKCPGIDCLSLATSNDRLTPIEQLCLKITDNENELKIIEYMLQNVPGIIVPKSNNIYLDSVNDLLKKY